MNPGSRKRLRKADLFPLRADSPGRDRMGGLDRPGSSRQLSERGVIVSNAVTVTKERPPRKKLTARRLKNLILNVLKNPFNMVVLVSLIVLFCLIVIPLLTMIKSTFTLAQGELRRVDGKVGDFTLDRKSVV